MQLWDRLGHERLEQPVDVLDLFLAGEGATSQAAQGQLRHARDIRPGGVPIRTGQHEDLEDRAIPQLGPEFVGGSGDKAAHLVDGLGPAAPGRRTSDTQNPHGLDVSGPGLGRSVGIAPLGGPGG
jgi:hypothetical protein